MHLQDHGHPVPFRNIWIRRIPSRFADELNGGLGVKRGAVAAKRNELARQALADAAATDDPAEKFIRLWESFCYEPDMKVRKAIAPATEALVAAVKANDAHVCEQARFNALKRFVKMLVRQKFLDAGTPLEQALDAHKAPPKPKAANLRDI